MNQNDLLVAIYCCCFDPEVHSNGWQTSLHKSIFNQSGHNAGFTDPRITQNNDFIVRHIDPIEFVQKLKMSFEFFI
jgi:hypothetical protein